MVTGPKGALIAGTHSGCGKTTVSLALMAACAARGLDVRPFKAGPDFIDPGLHELAAGAQSHNLDGWMLGHDACRELFARQTKGADIALVEGVMGLFDGASGRDERGSSAELAKWLGLPVLLVVDARSMARSAAALVQGYAGFDPALRLGGVIFNRVGSPRHRELLQEAMECCPKITTFGFLPRRQELELPSRHLGLHTAGEGTLDPERLKALAGWVEDSLDLDGLLHGLPAVALEAQAPEVPPKASGQGRVRLGLAWDRAFCFYYQENLRLLQAAGAELVFFSPLDDVALPEGLDGLYLGGGYPELHAAKLADNAAMRRQVREFALQGKPVYAECGGFMYLMQQLHTETGVYPMADVFAMQCRMELRLRSLGYREVVTSRSSLLGPAGTRFRGHEFHYSTIARDDAKAGAVYAMQGRNAARQSEGYQRQAALGSYVHAHFGSNPALAAAFVRACAGLDSGDTP